MASNNFINECKNPTNENRLGKLIIDNVEYNQGNYLSGSGFEIENNIYNNGTIIGSTYTKSLKASLINVNKDTQFVGKKVSPSVGVKYSNNTTEYINYDDFTVESINDEQTKNFTEITGYDALNELDKPFVYLLGEGEHTVAEYWGNLVANLGLDTNTTTFTNSDLVIPNNPFINNETNRVVLSEIEKVSCTFAEVSKVSLTTYLDLVWFSNSLDYEFQTSDYSMLQGTLVRYGPVNCILLGNANIEGENVYMQDDESIAQNGETKLLIDAEYFLFNQDLRTEALTAIYNKLNGFQYYDLTLVTPYGKPFLKVGNKIRVHTNEENTYDTYILSHKFRYDGTFYSEISSPALTPQEEIVKSTESISNRVRRTEIAVDKANQQISSTVIDVDSLSNLVDSQGQSIEELGTRLTQTANSITATVSGIQEELENGVNLVKTTSVTINDDGLSVSTDTSKIKTTMDNDSFEIKDSGNNTLAFFGYDETEQTSKAEMDNLTVTHYFVAGVHRIEKIQGENRTGFFYIGG